MHVTEINEWSGIWKLGLFKVVLHFLGVIVGGLSDDSLDFSVVSKSSA